MSTDGPSSSLAPSTRLGPYEITVPLGAGGMGEVYSARDTRLDRDVAVKLLPPPLAADPQFRARFEREARSISSLNHPHICTLHDVGTATLNGRELHYLVLELIEGETLAKKLEKGRLPLEDVLRLGAQIASALDGAHRRGIVHRDLKPGNMMITRAGAKLLDFGLARLDEGKEATWASSPSSFDPASRDTLTEQGTILGTFQYMAPEQPFVANGKLRRTAVSGGPLQTIADVQLGGDGTWGPNGVILYDGRTTDPVMRVDAAGGVPRPEVTPDPSLGGIGAGYPAFLPGGRDFLYYSLSDKPENNALMVRALDGTESRLIMKTPSQVVFAPPGYLLFVRERALVAQKFDLSTQQVQGEPIPIGEGLDLDFVGLASVSASTTGVLAYRTGQPTQRRLVWRDRSGNETPAMEEEAAYLNTWLSPDGRRLVYDLTETGDIGDIWIRDMERGTRTRFTYEREREFAPIGSPDGQRIVYTVQRKYWDLLVKDASGGGEPQLLLATDQDKYATDWTKDGTIVFQSRTEETSWDIWALPMNGKGKPFVLRATPFSEGNASVSPDGRFLVYQSIESGRMEIYVQEFPQARSKWQVSAAGGRDPFWRGDGRELFYRSPEGDLMAVPVVKGASFEPGRPQALFRGRFVTSNARSVYRPAADGKRFLMLAPPAQDTLQPATIVLNWTAGLP